MSVVRAASVAVILIAVAGSGCVSINDVPVGKIAAAAAGFGDEDRDGVAADHYDRCPRTKLGESVDTEGCACTQAPGRECSQAPGDSTSSQ